MPESVPVSVVIPALNAERFIAEAIESVQAQTLGVAEIIVVDNGCTDRTVNIAAKLGAKIIAEPEVGLSRARNAGIRASSQSWIALLDSDDLWDKNKLEKQWIAAKMHPNAGMVACYFRVIENGTVLIENSEETARERWLGYGDREVGADCSYFPKVRADFFPRFLPSCSDVLIKREVFDAVGMFDEAVKYNEDFEFFTRVLARYPFALVEETLISCRRHDRKHSRNTQAMRDAQFAVVNYMLQHKEKYPPGAPEVYRDRLKQHFLIVERAMQEARNKK
jgi:glycosyltransferase involved in cell wall biosynthesis